MEITDLWTIKINSEKYGELCFTRISEKLSDIISSVKNTPENIFEILMQNSFYEERNTIKKEDIDFSKFSENEKNNFYEKFLPLQFEGYEIDIKMNTYENFVAAIDFWQHQTNDKHIQLNEMMKKAQMNMSMALSGLRMDQIISATNRYLSQLQLSGIYNTIGKTTRDYFSAYNQNVYSNLSMALENLSSSMGPSIARINETLSSSLTNQIIEATKKLNVPFEKYTSALNFIPDNYSISKIFRDETGEIDIYVQDPEEESEYNLNNAEVDEGFFNFLRNIPKEKVVNFLTHLQEYPYLALIDATGKEIFEAVQNQISESIKIEKNMVFYRARAKKISQPDWTPTQMGELQYGFPNMQRYNFIGKPRLYLATEIETAKLEVENEKEPESTVMRLTQIKEMTVFDISTEDCPLVSYCNKDKEMGNDYTAYLIPNFLSVCCSYLNKKERHSVDAIKYKSNKNPNGFCYVILDKTPFEFFEDGEIVF